MLFCVITTVLRKNQPWVMALCWLANSYRRVGGYFWSHFQGEPVQECVCVCLCVCVSSCTKLPAVLVSNKIVLCQIWVAEGGVDKGVPRLLITWSSSKFTQNVDNYFAIDFNLHKRTIRWFKYDRDWFVCKQAALRSSCATLREWSHNLHPPSCSG